MKRGRKPTGKAAMVPISTFVPAEVYDALYRLATVNHTTVAAIARGVLMSRRKTDVGFFLHGELTAARPSVPVTENLPESEER
jgi:hypothetical protein